MKNQNTARANGPITGVGQVIAADVNTATVAVFTLAAAPTVAGHNCTFEFSCDSSNGVDGTWYQMRATRTNAATLEAATGVLAATPVYGWRAPCAGFRWVRVRCTAHTSGAANWIIRGATGSVV